MIDKKFNIIMLTITELFTLICVICLDIYQIFKLIHWRTKLGANIRNIQNRLYIYFFFL